MTVSPSTVRIEPITAETFPAWRSLRLRALKEHPDTFGASWEWYAGLSEAESRDHFASRQGPRSQVWGAFAEDGTVLGIAGLACETGPKEMHRAYIWGVYVAPEARGLHIGQRLIAEAIAFARSIAGVLQIHLAVTSHNEPARRLYERMGFVTYGREPRVLIVDGVGYDEDLMVLMLDAA
ncbi:MAG: GNAT family N-acetyltransferase [Thermomicrobiales bacterium]